MLTIFLMVVSAWHDLKFLTASLQIQCAPSQAIIMHTKKSHNMDSLPGCTVQGDFGHNWSKSLCFQAHLITGHDLSGFLYRYDVYFIHLSELNGYFPRGRFSLSTALPT
jgi:hypothetical protein